MARAVIQMGGGFANDSSKGKVKGKGNKRNGKAKSSHVTSGPVVSHLDAIVGNADRSLATGTRAAATANWPALCPRAYAGRPARGRREAPSIDI